MVVNGADDAQVYNGTSFAASTITGVDTSLLSHVWKHASRLFFVEKDTQTAWFLGVDSISGTATSLSLAGTFQRGGALLFGGTWSMDSGDGMDDRCVFVSTKGEVAVYQGTDPANASAWSLVGRYDISPPLGKNATMRAGGDFLVATREGIIPLSQIVAKDPAALSFDAVSRPIFPTWEEEVAQVSENIDILKWDEISLALVYFPGSSRTLSVGLERGAWGIQPGGGTANCGQSFMGGAYIGKDDGRIYRINTSGTDDGTPFTSRYCHSFSDFGAPAAYKRAQMVRYAFFSAQEFEFRAEMSVDYQVEFGAAPEISVAQSDVDAWNDGSQWNDGSTWSGGMTGPSTSFTAKWRTVSNSGYALGPTLQITSGGPAALALELVRADLAYEVGQAVV